MSSESIRANLPHDLISTPSWSQTHTNARPILCRRCIRRAIIGEIVFMVITKIAEIGAGKIRQRSGNTYSKKPQGLDRKISSPSTSEFLLSLLHLLILL